MNSKIIKYIIDEIIFPRIGLAPLREDLVLSDRVRRVCFWKVRLALWHKFIVLKIGAYALLRSRRSQLIASSFSSPERILCYSYAFRLASSAFSAAICSFNSAISVLISALSSAMALPKSAVLRAYATAL